MNRHGVSLFEVIALLLILAAAWVGDSFGSQYSNIAGIVCMVLFPLLLVFGIEKLAWLERELFIGQKPFPACPCGRGTIDSLPGADEKNAMPLNCKCGRAYDTSGRGLITIIEGDIKRDFATWKPFKGWLVSEPSGEPHRLPPSSE
ncbi:MAG TPA: hypothetical protein PLM07_09340 [Candidatus Rifleibacterium sp.]|nr:hypothetical protein [Candidatus Rifleibacterium sp.]HPT46091.1 hypothetical protein [Candidatus Rifleibacterium sp.]